MNRKKNKICLVCGSDFLGIESAITCKPSCRTYMSRLIAKGKRPEFYFIAKGKGQKVPELKKESELPEPKKSPPEGMGKLETLKWLRENG